MVKLKRYIDFLNETLQYKKLQDLSYDDISKVERLWHMFKRNTGLNGVEHAKVVNYNNNLYKNFIESNPDIGNEMLNTVLDFFTYGKDEYNEHELPKEKIPTAKDLYDYFQSEEFTNYVKSSQSIGKYKL